MAADDHAPRPGDDPLLGEPARPERWGTPPPVTGNVAHDLDPAAEHGAAEHGAAEHGAAEHEADEAGPRIPRPEDVGDLRPVQDVFLAMLDEVSERTLGRPLKPRMQMSPQGLMRGEIDLVKIELPAMPVSGLVVDHFVVQAERVRVKPGLPGVLLAGPVTLRAVVSQESVDRWTKDMRLPFRLRLTERGVVTTTGIGGIRVGEIVTEPTVVGGFLKLRPRSASLLGMPTPLVRFLRGYLPLPPLPRDAHLQHVEPADGELTLTFVIDRFEQPLTPDVLARFRKAMRLPLPGL